MITRRFYDQQIHSMVIEALRVRFPRILRNMRFLFKATLDGQMMVCYLAFALVCKHLIKTYSAHYLQMIYLTQVRLSSVCA